MLTVDDLKLFMGITTTDAGLDAVVGWAVDTTNALVLVRCENHLDDVTPWSATAEFAAKLQGARLVKRRASPEGVAGMGDFGPIRVVGLDPDIENLLSPSLWFAFG